jgi:hypothetical protein
MRHLEAQRSNHLHRRNERMNRGVGCFVDGETTLSGWHFSPNAAAYKDQGTEGALNARQQSLGLFPAQDMPRTEDSTPYTPNPDSLTKESSYFAIPRAPASTRRHVMDILFSRAANIIREAIEVEGCIFYRPRPTFHTRRPMKTDDGEQGWSYTSSSTSSGEADPAQEARACQVLGFSTTDTSSIDSALHTMPDAPVAEGFMATLLRWYPQGAVFNFDADGELVSSDLSSDDELSQTLAMTDLGAKPTSPSTAEPTTSSKPFEKQQHRPKKKRRSRDQVVKALRDAFPHARCVVFSPVWDTLKDDYCAGLFATSCHRR